MNLEHFEGKILETEAKINGFSVIFRVWAGEMGLAGGIRGGGGVSGGLVGLRGPNARASCGSP